MSSLISRTNPSYANTIRYTNDMSVLRRELRYQIKLTIRILTQVGGPEKYIVGRRFKITRPPYNARLHRKGWPVRGYHFGPFRNVVLLSNGHFFLPASSGRSYHVFDDDAFGTVSELRTVIQAVMAMREGH